MAGTYREVYAMHEVWEVEVNVEGASSEERAEGIANLFAGWNEGKYDAGGGILVTINRTLQDSDIGDTDEQEWEDDE